MTGFSSHYNKTGPAGLPHPSQAAVKVNATATTANSAVFISVATATVNLTPLPMRVESY